MTGPVLAKLVESMVGALNARDIPTAGSILEHFNRDLVHKARPLDTYLLFLQPHTLLRGTCSDICGTRRPDCRPSPSCPLSCM